MVPNTLFDGVANEKPMNKVPFRISPMLATLADAPFSRPNWIHEEKYDGVRILAYKEGPRVSLISRNAIDRTARYPEIAAAVASLKARTIALDGEVVVFDARNVSRFQLLQQGEGRRKYAVFDVLYANGGDLRKSPLSARRDALERLVQPSSSLLLSERLAHDGLKAFQLASRRGFEGIMAKNLSSPYVEGRSAQWLKVKVHQEDEFVIGGFTKPSGSRNYFGALLLGVYSHGQLRYAGKVGTGFDEKTLESLYRKFSGLVRVKSPFSTEVQERGATFLSPHLVAQISFTEQTKDGKLRHPVFLGLRDDKSPKEVVQEEA
jgi:bifunctional non-homologous end joining protein LigD